MNETAHDHPTAPNQGAARDDAPARDFDRITCVIRYLDEHHAAQPDLAELASLVELSPGHFHRLFARWAGVTPKDFLQCLTLSHARAALADGASVLQASLEAGLSGPGRLHDLCVTLTAASPGEIKSGGAGWTIRAGLAASPFGLCLVGESPRGICHLSFVDSASRPVAAAAIAQEWPQAKLEWDDALAERTLAAILAPADSSEAMDRANSVSKSPATLRAVVRGTPFQVRVWQALLHVPRGSVVSYGQLADVVCTRAAARAVGGAVGQNRLALLIPCHRVIRETGVFGPFRWGPTRKQALVAWEASCSTGRQSPPQPTPANR